MSTSHGKHSAKKKSQSNAAENMNAPSQSQLSTDASLGNASVAETLANKAPEPNRQPTNINSNNAERASPKPVQQQQKQEVIITEQFARRRPSRCGSFLRFLLISFAFMYASGILRELAQLANPRVWFLTYPKASQCEWMNATGYEEGGATSSVLKRMVFPRPVRGPKQLLVKVVKAAGNPVDFKMRQMPYFPLKTPPSIPGYDFAGYVVEADANSSFSVGQRVFGMLPTVSPTWGTFAEYLVSDEAFAAVIPEGISFTEAAATPLAGLTALQALASLGPVMEGRSVLIHAGSGGVGSFLIQIAKRVLKLKVYTTSSNVELCKSLGADVVINYKNEKFEDVLDKYDYVIDPMGGSYLLRSLPITKRHYVSILNSGWEDYFGGMNFRALDGLMEPVFILLVNARHYLTFGAYPKYSLTLVETQGKSLQVLADWIKQGKIRVLLDDEFVGLEEGARKVHDRLQSGRAKGKVTLSIE